jgi:hypothetical protein
MGYVCSQLLAKRGLLAHRCYRLAKWVTNKNIIKKEFKDLEDFLISFRLHFVIAEHNFFISTMYYLLYMWY